MVFFLGSWYTLPPSFIKIILVGFVQSCLQGNKQTSQAGFLTTHNYLLKSNLNSSCIFITKPTGAYVPGYPASLVELLEENRMHDLTYVDSVMQHIQTIDQI